MLNTPHEFCRFSIRGQGAWMMGNSAGSYVVNKILRLHMGLI